MSTDCNGTSAAITLPVDAVCGLLAPVPAPVRGTTVSAAGTGTSVAVGTELSHNTDMGAVAFIERAGSGSVVGEPTAWTATGVQLKQRNSVTRGKPPREHPKG